MLLRITSRWAAHSACDDEVSHLISIQNPDANLDDLRPESIVSENHLVLLFEDIDDAGRPVPAHHPFTMPHPDDLDQLAFDLAADSAEDGAG